MLTRIDSSLKAKGGSYCECPASEVAYGQDLVVDQDQAYLIACDIESQDDIDSSHAIDEASCEFDCEEGRLDHEAAVGYRQSTKDRTHPKGRP